MLKRTRFAGAGLITGTPTAVTVHQTSGDTTLPYFLMPPAPVGAEEAIHYRIDSVVQEAIAEAALPPQRLKRAGLFVGSTSFDMASIEMALKRISKKSSAPCNAEDIARHVPPFTRLTRYVQARFGIDGPLFTFNTACTSSANALLYAAMLLERGEIEDALVLGLEFYNEVTALGFSGLQLVSSRGMSPFAEERDGLWLGEGCSALVASSRPGSGEFGLLGGASMGDRFSMTASNPEGVVVEAVIRRALAHAGIGPDGIAITKTHGTASLSNDEAEAAGMAKVFGDKSPPIAALKPLIGHTLGACGINELVLFYRALQQGKVATADCAISSRFGLRLATAADIPQQGNYLLNYFGFGGNSTALVIGNG